MSQTSSGPPAVDLTSPESPPLCEQGIIEDATKTINDNSMDISQSATEDELKDNNYLLAHPAIKNNVEPTIEHYLFFDDLLKEAATLMDKVHKSASAANNVRSPSWEITSMKIEECSRRIRAICTYTGVPASLLPTKKELLEMRKQKDLETLNREAEIQAAREKHEKEAPPAPVTNQIDTSATTQTNGAATKRKTPTSDDDDESFTVVKARKEKRPTFTSRPVNESRAYSEVLRKANQGKQVSHAPQPITAQEVPLPRANPNLPAPAVTERVVYNSGCSLSEILQCLMDLQKDNPSHSHIILQAFGLAKDKMRNSQDKFDMGYHLFAAYTQVLSTSEFCTA
ncbi:hypothetical protein CDAR_317951 [Caerostris darwini]|uniref:Uncharacterized protein n=1 Tax=Caerostris darwini TaxID=1538125 RepID=A0AAV4WQZ3_9ARAC|nr:hypothetical protein CDAR_317951 [Caerostris darwini]